MNDMRPVEGQPALVRPKIGLALGGGAARGWAHIGALEVLIEAGFAPGSTYEVVEDRRQAIAAALAMASRGDTVLIAGKGHETFQEFANKTIPFDDRQVVKECL